MRRHALLTVPAIHSLSTSSPSFHNSAPHFLPPHQTTGQHRLGPLPPALHNLFKPPPEKLQREENLPFVDCKAQTCAVNGNDVRSRVEDSVAGEEDESYWRDGRKGIGIIVSVERLADLVRLASLIRRLSVGG